jgi:succinate dehydrogenase / fumarate reductase cytochrome b subunit
MQSHSHWFEVRVQPSGMLAFMLHRITGLGLVAYLFLHLALLNQLRQGPSAWNGFVEAMRSPWVTFLDALLLLGILIHGLNGVRLALIGAGILVRYQKTLFWIGLALAVALSAVGVAAMR